jgi:hypothetical protein
LKKQKKPSAKKVPSSKKKTKTPVKSTTEVKVSSVLDYMHKETTSTPLPDSNKENSSTPSSDRNSKISPTVLPDKKISKKPRFITTSLSNKRKKSFSVEPRLVQGQMTEICDSPDSPVGRWGHSAVAISDTQVPFYLLSPIFSPSLMYPS